MGVQSGGTGSGGNDGVLGVGCDRIGNILSGLFVGFRGSLYGQDDSGEGGHGDGDVGAQRRSPHEIQ